MSEIPDRNGAAMSSSFVHEVETRAFRRCARPAVNLLALGLLAFISGCSSDERLKKLERELAETKEQLEALSERPDADAPHGEKIVVDSVTARRITIVNEEGEPRATLATVQGTTMLEFSDKGGKKRMVLFAAQARAGIDIGDDSGQIRASLKTTEKGTHLKLQDEHGKVRAMIFEALEGSSITLKDANGNPRAELLLDEKEGPCIDIADEKGNMAAKLVMQEYGAVLHILDADGKAKALFGKSKSGTVLSLSADHNQNGLIATTGNDGASVNLYDSKERSRVELSVLGNVPMLRLRPENGKPGAVVGVSETEGPMFGLFDPAGEVRGVFGTGKNGEPRLYMYDAQGKTVWQARQDMK